MSEAAPPTLDLIILIYTAHPQTQTTAHHYPSYASEHHTALTLGPDSLGQYHRYHVIEGPSTNSVLRFEHKVRWRRGSVLPHHVVSVSSGIAESLFGEYDAVVRGTPVRTGGEDGDGWNCQTWVRDALVRLEHGGLLAEGTAAKCWADAWEYILSVADREDEEEGEKILGGFGFGNMKT